MTDNILKLKGFGLYVTYVDNKLYTSEIQSSGGPKLDPDKCVEWTELTDPPNQEFLNVVNRNWRLKLKTSDYGKIMSISECLWYVKNLKECQK